ncbi:MmcQ/YjbR family DNA-binding protein [Actinokineospora bangkokensis]|uniref:Cytoplasmic protein n=1 Tax=Actinokineospora bangkokensis TaxID=1193682 RepID=A0A1Q9LMG8_9PSEU|nr:MmcQ/YjbR family DNA-binding protein [Actinokineospora bangkokensis]OLR93236.1 cytoplasmic protein [Actinokineospora bangkokensis]
MEGEALHRCARSRAEQLPAAVAEQPFGPGSQVYKVKGKVFVLLTELAGRPIVNVKCAPEDGVALRGAHADIVPGYHMNKRHWITLNPGGTLTEDLVEDLVTDSYLLVVRTLPKAQRPIDPDAEQSYSR